MIMARVAVLAVLFAVAAAQVDDDNCKGELKTLMLKYSGRECGAVLNKTITATVSSDCPNKSWWIDCFSEFEDSWTDLVDDCEDIFEDSACLKSLGDDQFERTINDECQADRRRLMAWYSNSDPCSIIIHDAAYAANDTACPPMAKLGACFFPYEDDWTDAMDECEDSFWKYSGCTELKNFSDDEFEDFVKDSEPSAAFAAGSAGVTVLAAAGGALLLLLLAA